MIAFILAGGKGTRLQDITKSVIPKPMVEICGKPILQYQIEFLSKNGISEVVLSLGYQAEKIKEYFKDGKGFGLKIKYSLESEPLGTAGAFKYAEPLFGKGEDILVLYGDLVLDFDLSRMIKFHEKHDGLGTLFVHPNNHPYDSDLLKAEEDGEITKWIPKPHSNSIYPNLVNAGIYIFRSEIFSHIEPGKKMDFGKDIFPKIIDSKKKIYAYRSSEYVKDVGTIKRYEEAEKDILDMKPNRRNFMNKQKVIFLDRDGVINKEVDLLYKPEQLELIEGVPKAIKKANESDYLTIIVTNQSVVARGLCTEEDVKTIHDKLETLLGEKNAFIDRIYYCPYHPEKGFPGENPKYKRESECRKPKTGMLIQAEKDFNIDKKDSFLIGDSTVDIQTGINYGVQTILVRTGYKGLDGKYSVKPDYEFADLQEAINFIINEYPHCVKFCNEILDSSDKVFLIGGNSRSGKSTLASVLKHSLEVRNKKVRILSLDNWLLPLEKRKEGMTVFERYNKNKLLFDINALLNGKKIVLRPYDPYTRKLKDEELELHLSDEKFLILDGVISLELEELRRISNTRIFVKTDEEIRRKRFYEFYRYKGMNEEKIKELYIERYNEEFAKITETEKFANRVFDWGESGL